MDPFTQRMLERARARQEKIDQKLASSGQTVPKRKPLTENSLSFKKGSESSPVKSPSKPRRESVKTDSLKSTSRKSDIKSPQKQNVIVTKNHFGSPKRSNSSRKSDVSVEINITHRDDIQIEVQVEEREAPLTIQKGADNSIVIKEIEDVSRKDADKCVESNKDDNKPALRQNVKSRLDRLGVMYSDKADLSSPIHRTEQEFTSETPPACPEIKEKRPEGRRGKGKFGRLAALANEINNWEDDLSHHNFHPEPQKKATSKPDKRHDASTLDVSIHSLEDINKALHDGSKNKQTNKKAVNTATYSRQSTKKCQLDKEIVAELLHSKYSNRKTWNQ